MLLPVHILSLLLIPWKTLSLSQPSSSPMHRDLAPDAEPQVPLLSSFFHFPLVPAVQMVLLMKEKTKPFVLVPGLLLYCSKPLPLILLSWPSHPSILVTPTLQPYHSTKLAFMEIIQNKNKQKTPFFGFSSDPLQSLMWLALPSS